MKSYQQLKDFLQGQYKLNPYLNLDNYGSVSGDYVGVEWRTGGYSGGDCYGGTAEPIDADDEPEFDVLMTAAAFVLEKDEAEFTETNSRYAFECYFIENGQWHTGTHSDYSDYYGNGNEYEHKYVLLEDLYSGITRYFRSQKIERILNDE